MDVEYGPSPWDWRSDRRPWFKKLATSAEAWAPHPAIGVDHRRVRDALGLAAHDNADWLLHPAACTLTASDRPNPLLHDLNLLLWSGLHADIGKFVRVPISTRAWSPAGPLEVEAGDLELEKLRDRARTVSWPVPWTVDVACDSLGYALPDSWAALVHRDAEQNAQLRADLIALLRTLKLAQIHLPGCAAWACSVTRVLVPLYAASRPKEFRSGSDPTVPGLVSLDIHCGLLQVLEALVHESAHRHLFLAEVHGPLVEPTHHDRYPSPLRPELRPLRGVLLAYHALAYICALYREVRLAGLEAATVVDAEEERMVAKLADSERTIEANRGFLTAWGNEFFDRTQRVARWKPGSR